MGTWSLGCRYVDAGRQLFDALALGRILSRIDQVVHPHCKVHRPIGPRAGNDHDRCFVEQGKQRDGFVARCRPAQKIDDAAPLAGVLIADQGQDAARGEHFVRLARAVILRQNPLPFRLAKSPHQRVEIRIVERPRHGVRPKTPKAAHVPQGLEIAEVPRDTNL